MRLDAMRMGNAGAPASCCIERPEATVMGTDAPATAGAKDPSPDPSPGGCPATHEAADACWSAVQAWMVLAESRVTLARTVWSPGL
ncbi:hypothetical protein Y1Q_0004712 [Alligator mississippiensis]|uniref:Uncharacterized protein n=1 Tax=Alligator mississippiensis TaxID=8496 RepID=A0A151MLC1_ALLMI|nr:hypothetical protein Y1Q_0004712 [Alligator mississippiensis]